MPAHPASSSSKLVSLMLVGGLCVAAWFVAPWFFPVWRWRYLDFDKIAAASHETKAEVSTPFDAVLRYHPRGLGDPLPWQIVTLSPNWRSSGPHRVNEKSLLVRCTLISDRTGQPPGTMWVGSTARDEYFRAKVWRFDPIAFTAFSLNSKRPVVLYDANTWDKLTVTDSVTQDEICHNWENDDHWRNRNDGWQP